MISRTKTKTDPEAKQGNSENRNKTKKSRDANLSDQQRDRRRVGRKAHADDDGGLLAHEARDEGFELGVNRSGACDRNARDGRWLGTE